MSLGSSLQGHTVYIIEVPVVEQQKIIHFGSSSTGVLLLPKWFLKDHYSFHDFMGAYNKLSSRLESPPNFWSFLSPKCKPCIQVHNSWSQSRKREGWSLLLGL